VIGCWMTLQMTGDMVPLEALSVVEIANLQDRLTELVRRVRELRLDLNDYICLKYILLLNPGRSSVAHMYSVNVNRRRQPWGWGMHLPQN